MSVSRAKIEAAGNGRFRITGQLDAASVVGVLDQSRELFAAAKVVDVDLGGVTESDSSGLALLLEWLRLSKLAERRIHFNNLPPQISALARISEVEDLFTANGDAVAPEVVHAPIE